MNISQKVYNFLVRKNKDISSLDKNLVKNNYLIFLAGGFVTQIADILSSTKTVLVWLMNALGAPIFLTTLLVPIRESGSMLPQIFLTNFISKNKKRLPVWVIGGIIQAVSLIIIGIASRYFNGMTIGIVGVIMIAVFSFGRSLCSLSSKDIMGRTIPKKIRGSLTGYTQAISGIAVLVFGLWFQAAHFENNILSYVIIVAGILWLIAIIIYSQIIEPPVTETYQKDNALFGLLKILKEDRVLQKFIFARALLLCSALTSPFYILLAQQSNIQSLGVLGLFIIVTGIAGIISSPIWGHLADTSSQKVMAYAGYLSSILAFIVVITGFLYPTLSYSWLFYVVIIFLVTVAHNGVRIGRKTYIVNIAEGDMRIRYISISNSVIAIILLAVGVISSLLSLISLYWALGILGIMGMFGGYLSSQLPSTLKS